MIMNDENADNINPEVKKALDFAFIAHKEQFRKGTTVPYIAHILDVLKYLLYDYAPTEVLVAGVLHDTLEDTHCTRDDLMQFGHEVVGLVEFCSEPGNTVESENKSATWKKRKTHTIESLKNATRNQATIILADKLSNVMCMREDQLASKLDWSKFNASKQDIEWYYTELVNGLTLVQDTRMYPVFKDTVEKVFS